MALAALLLLAMLRLGTPPGETAVVTTPGGTVTLPLSADAERTFTGKGDIPVTVEVQGGRVRVAHSGCPDQVCVHSGWLSRSGSRRPACRLALWCEYPEKPAAGIDAVAQ